MKNPTTDEMIADVLAIHFQVQRHLQDKRHRVTALQAQVLTDAVTNINRFLIAWQTQALSKRKLVTSQRVRRGHSLLYNAN
jgi:hypothetical protein